MATAKQTAACTAQTYHVTKHMLPLSCPTEEMTLWDAHPRVFLPIEATGEVVCPYCGTHFILKDDE